MDDENAVRGLLAEVGVDEVTVVTGLSPRADVSSDIVMLREVLSLRPQDADLVMPGTYKDAFCPTDDRKS